VLAVRQIEVPSERFVLGGPGIDALDPTLGFQARHGPHGVRAGQPVQRGKGLLRSIERVVPDDQGMAVTASGDDGELGQRRTAELLSDPGQVGSSQLPDGAQRRLWSMARR
jgi:hypothetical protein